MPVTINEPALRLTICPWQRGPIGSLQQEACGQRSQQKAQGCHYSQEDDGHGYLPEADCHYSQEDDGHGYLPEADSSQAERHGRQDRKETPGYAIGKGASHQKRHGARGSHADVGKHHEPAYGSKEPRAQDHPSLATRLPRWWLSSGHLKRSRLAGSGRMPVPQLAQIALPWSSWAPDRR